MAEPDGAGGGLNVAPDPDSDVSPGDPPPDTRDGPPTGPDDRDRPTETRTPPDPTDEVSPFGPPPVALPPAALPWDTDDSPAVLGDGFAIETRAETLELLTLGNRVHQGDEAHLRTGAVGEFVDTVAGEERATVHGRLTERTAKASRLVAAHQQTTVHGRLSISAVGWPENALSGEDGIILGGAMTDTWTGGTLIAAAMSDDLVVGAGARITAPVDIWMNALHGMEERPGSALADGVTVDLCGTLFEREYGAAIHAAGIAVFSGTVYQTQRMGFRPMMKVALGVRNLVPGAGAGAAAPTPPAPPAGAGAAEGAMLVTGVAAGGAGMARSMDSFQDMGRVVDSAGDLQNASDLARAANTADTVDDLGRVRLADGFDEVTLTRDLDDLVEARNGRIDALEGIETNAIEQVNRQIADRIDELDALGDAGRPTGDLDFTPPPPKPSGTQTSGDLQDVSAHLVDIPEATRLQAEAETEIAKIRWPGTVADGSEARRTQLGAEIDALAALKLALETDEDPVAFLRQMADGITDLDGAADPRTIALQDTSAYYSRISSVVDVLQDEVDLYMLARSEIEAGFDPRPALRNVAAAAPGSDAARQAQNVLDWLDGYFGWFDFLDGDFGTATDDVDDLVDVRRAGDDVPPPAAIDPVPAGLDPPPAPVPDASDLGTDPATMDLLAPDPGDQVRQALDPPPPQGAEDLADSLRVDADSVPPPATLEPGAPGAPLVETRFDDTGAGWLDDAGTRAADVGDAVDGTRGDYERMAPGGGALGALDDAEDTRAVVDGVPARSLPEDFDWEETYSSGLMDPYMQARRDLDWRPTMAYGDALNGLRDDLQRGLTEILGSSEGLEGKRADDLYARAREVANSADAVQAQKARELLETIDAKTYDLVAVLSTRTEEFAGAARRHPLDQHIDQAKLLDWLMARQNDAAERVHTATLDAEHTVAGQEMSYWQQVFMAVGEGRSPVAESSEQIAYLRSVGNTEQVDAYLSYHDDLLQTVSDPTFHRTAAEMGDNTYAPRAGRWRELSTTAAMQAYQNALLNRRAEFQDELAALARLVDDGDIPGPPSVIDEPGRTSDLRDMIRNFATGVETVDGAGELDAINARLRALADDLAGGAPDVADADSALRPVDNVLGAGGGLESSDLFRNLLSDEMMDEGYLAAIDGQGRGSLSDLTGETGDLADPDIGDYAVGRDEINRQVGVRDFARAPLRPPTGLRHFAVGATRGLGIPRSASPEPGAPPGPVPDSGDSIIGGGPPPGDNLGLAGLTRDANVPAAWDRPALSGPVRTWESGVRSGSVRFGAGRNPSREEAEEGATAGGEAGDAGGEKHWWMGGGRGTDPLNLDGALQRVSASSRMCADASGFGGGASPFGARAELVADLMRGQLLKPASVDALRGTVAEGRRGGRGRNPESANLAALLRALRSGGDPGQGRPTGGTLDWRTLEILLDMLDSSAAMC